MKEDTSNCGSFVEYGVRARVTDEGFLGCHCFVETGKSIILCESVIFLYSSFFFVNLCILFGVHLFVLRGREGKSWEETIVRSVYILFTTTPSFRNKLFNFIMLIQTTFG